MSASSGGSPGAKARWTVRLFARSCGSTVGSTSSRSRFSSTDSALIRRRPESMRLRSSTSFTIRVSRSHSSLMMPRNFSWSWNAGFFTLSISVSV